MKNSGTKKQHIQTIFMRNHSIQKLHLSITSSEIFVFSVHLQGSQIFLVLKKLRYENPETLSERSEFGSGFSWFQQFFEDLEYLRSRNRTENTNISERPFINPKRAATTPDIRCNICSSSCDILLQIIALLLLFMQYLFYCIFPEYILFVSSAE